MGKVKGKHIKESYENTSFYEKSPNKILGDYYYIHLHKKNVGRMNMGHDDGANSHSDANISKLLSKYNDNHENMLSHIVTNQYMQLLKSSIDNIPENQWLIQKGLDINTPGSVEILENLQKVLKEGFENQFDASKMKQMLQLEASTASFAQDSDYKKESLKALDKLINGVEDADISKAFEFIDNILTGLAKTVELLESPKGGNVAVAISLLKKNYSSLSSLGSKLESIVDHYLEQENGSTIQSRDFIETMGYLKNLSIMLKTGKNLGKDSNPMSIESLQKMIQTNFYSNVGEIFANNMKKASINEVVNFHNRMLHDIQRFGEERFLVEFTDANGNYTNNYMRGSYYNSSSKLSLEQGKADNKFNNVVVSLEGIFEDLSGKIKMSVGVSNKSYATAHIGSLSDNFNSIGLGGGMNLAAGIDLLYSEDIYKKYLSYNIIARNQSVFPKSLASLQDALLTRNIVYLAAGRGKQDFSQLLLINGEVMSMWDIVNYAINNDVGLSASKILKKKKHSVAKTTETNNGVFLSIPARQKIIEAASLPNWSERVSKTNQKIGLVSMNLHIIPAKIIAYANSLN